MYLKIICPAISVPILHTRLFYGLPVNYVRGCRVFIPVTGVVQMLITFDSNFGDAFLAENLFQY